MKIGIVVGSTREGRIGIDIARWILAQSAGRDAEYELLDLCDFDLPLYTFAAVPALADRQYDDPRIDAWSRAVDACDGFVFVSAEHNHGVPGVFKNAFDCLFPEWWSKSVAFVAYGAALGFRVVEQWRMIVATANMYDVKAQVGFSTITDFADGRLVPSGRHPMEIATLFDSVEAAAAAMAGMRAAV